MNVYIIPRQVCIVLYSYRNYLYFSSLSSINSTFNAPTNAHY